MEFDINWTQVVIGICSIVITTIVIPFVRSLTKQIKEKLSKDQQETIEYWVEVGVRWAKQWLQSETGEKKKEEVFIYVSSKMLELGIDVSDEDLDRIIEAIYEQVKNDSPLLSSNVKSVTA